MSAIQDYLVICCREQWQGGLYCHVEGVGDTLQLAAPHHTGVYCLPPVDSGENGFSWSRLIVSAHLPQDCGLRIYTHCADQANWPAWDSLRIALQEQKQNPASVLRDCFGPPVPPGTDCWLSGSGRYLWVAFELTATGGGLPTIHSLQLRMGGDHMLDYLPAIYRGDEFTLRYLSIFNSMFQDMEDAVEALPRQLDPGGGLRIRCFAPWHSGSAWIPKNRDCARVSAPCWKSMKPCIP